MVNRKIKISKYKEKFNFVYIYNVIFSNWVILEIIASLNVEISLLYYT